MPKKRKKKFVKKEDEMVNVKMKKKGTMFVKKNPHYRVG